MTKVIVWNINRKQQALRELVTMGVDLALLQEVHPGGWEWLASLGGEVEVTPHEPWLPWPRSHYDRWPLVVKLSDRVQVDWFRPANPIHWPTADDFPVSGIGTTAVARVIPEDDVQPFIAVSMYARWSRPHPTAGNPNWIYPDASAHRIISDLSVFISSYDSNTHRILAGGGLNVAFFTADGFDARAKTIVDRMDALGLEYMGPQYPDGRLSNPRPNHLPEDTRNVPTYYTRSRTPASAHVQVDHVFASRGFHESVGTRALNEVDEWGPSDHCRVLVEIS